MTELVTVVNTKPNFRRINQVENGSIKAIKLDPGANLLAPETVATIKRSKNGKVLFERGILREEAPPSESKTFKKGDHVSRITDLKVPDALAAIAACSDPALLAKWAEQDGRKTVKEALLKRHAEMVADEDPAEEDKD
ncbi:MAG TPA: hypothetical protein VHK86_01815 [Nitrososphaera sp.]|jgi:hypothetical protein|nr:hypothetical protein [Nitrososphaera sp.]